MAEWLEHVSSLATPKKILYCVCASATIFVSIHYVRYRIKQKSKKFNGYTTSDEALNGIDLSDKYAIVTGCNTGLGKQTVESLYKHNCNVVMACRNIDKANNAKNDIISKHKNMNSSNLNVMICDLSSLQSVRDFANKLNEKYKKIDFMINNAGIMNTPKYTKSKDGIELQFAVNHLSHFYLNRLLLQKFIENKTRVICLSSLAHFGCSFKQYNTFLDKSIENKCGPMETDYDPWIAYGISKISNALFAREMNRKYNNNNNDGIVAVSCNPGMVQTTELFRQGLPSLTLSEWIIMAGMVFDLKSMSQGAATTLRLVSIGNDEIKGGHYYHNCQSGRDSGDLFDSLVIREYQDYENDSIESKLWDLSESLIQSLGFELDL